MEQPVWAERRAKPRGLSLLAASPARLPASPLALFFFALLALPLVFSCGGRTMPKPEDGVAGFVDEAFAVLLPGAAEILARLPDGQKPGPGPGKSAGQAGTTAPLALAAIE
ncbi:MAG: hypothetical protein WCX13_00525, partial [Candidatus Hydrogenedentales bacterium]